MGAKGEGGDLVGGDGCGKGAEDDLLAGDDKKGLEELELELGVAVTAKSTSTGQVQVWQCCVAVDASGSRRVGVSWSSEWVATASVISLSVSPPCPSLETRRTPSNARVATCAVQHLVSAIDDCGG